MTGGLGSSITKLAGSRSRPGAFLEPICRTRNLSFLIFIAASLWVSWVTVDETVYAGEQDHLDVRMGEVDRIRRPRPDVSGNMGDNS